MTNDYKTSDMPLAAYLVYKGFTIESIENDLIQSRKKLFLFNRKPGQKIEDIAQEFYAKRGLVEPLEYFNCTKELKNRLYANGTFTL